MILRLFYTHSNLSGPIQAVCYREVSTIRGVCYKWFHCTVNHALQAHNMCGCENRPYQSRIVHTS